MSSNKRGLGRGFDSLIPTDLIDESLDPTADEDEKLSQLKELKLSDVEPNPDQPRRSFDDDALDGMAESIKEHGVLQPIVVVPKNGKYQIVAGERRYRASKRAGMETIPALIRSLSDQNQLEVSLIENLQRRDLNVLETATAYLKLRDQFNLSLEQIGTKVGGKSISSISNTLRLLRLPESVRKALQDGRITEGQAKPLVNVDAEVVEAVLPRILKEEWSARRVEQFIVDLKKSADTKKAAQPEQNQHNDVTKLIADRFSAKVHIRSNTRGSGAITIRFSNDEELKRITDLLNQ